MKTNLVKTTIVAVAISFALVSCENDTLNEMETKRVNIEKIKPIDNHNDRELERDLLKKLPVRKEFEITPTTQSEQKENKSIPVRKEKEVMPQYNKKMINNFSKLK